MSCRDASVRGTIDGAYAGEDGVHAAPKTMRAVAESKGSYSSEFSENDRTYMEQKQKQMQKE